MFIWLECTERQEYARPRILQFAFISFSISSQLSGLLSDCHMLFQQDELTMDFTQHFPLYLHSTNFSQWPNNALNNTVVDFALLIYTRIFLWYINKRGSKDMCILKCNRKCQSNVQIDFTTTLILYKGPCFGFPGGPVVKSLPANPGHMGSIPGLGRSHMPRATKLVCQNNWAHHYLESLLLNKRSLCNEKPENKN